MNTSSQLKTPHRIGDSESKFRIWQQAFSQIEEQSRCELKLTEEAILISDVGFGDHDEATVSGVVEQDGKKINIKFKYVATWNDVSDVTHTVQ